MRSSSIIVGGLIAAGLLNAPTMAASPEPFTANPPAGYGSVVAVRSQGMTLQRIAQAPQPRAPRRVIYSAKPELR